VLQAQSGREAMVVLGSYSDSLKLVISHAELPDVSGCELLRAVNAACPNVRLLLTSTQDPGALNDLAALPSGTEILRKPFGHGDLVEHTRRALAANDDRLTVLVVEDDASALAAHEETLSQEGFRVVGADSAGQALEWLVNHAGEADALVTDLHLADADGGWLARELRALGDDIPILFLTGSSPDDPLLRGVLDEPRTALLAKPAEMSLLAGAVRRMVQG
jgi:DNA-binding response OmpR family regulator